MILNETAEKVVSKKTDISKFIFQNISFLIFS